MKWLSIRTLPLWIAIPLLAGGPQSGSAYDWPQYGRDPGGARYAPLDQINRDTVARLEKAWEFRTGDVSRGEQGRRKSKFEATPILFGGALYLSTPFSRVIALDPATGARLWAFDPKLDLGKRYSESLVSRGVASWTDARAEAGAPCARRIFFAALDGRLLALDAATGKPCVGFGENGVVDSRAGIGKTDPKEYTVTSPPVVCGDVVAVGSAIGDNRAVTVEPGAVRAFDARTGKRLWLWDPIPRSHRDKGWETWASEGARKTGAANVWSIMTADPERGLIFAPTGSASPDYYGGERLGANLFANCVVALEAKTGAVVWHFQVVHHDLWDYDVAAAPALATVRRDGRDTPAVVVNTKMGHVFVLHRETGEPLFPIEERPTPRSDVAGELAAPTQPFPVKPKPLIEPVLTPDQVWGATESDRRYCAELLASLRNEGMFTPPSLQGTLVNPGFVGGVNWGGAAIHGGRGVMVANINRLPFWVRLIPRDRFAQERRADRIGAQFTAQRGAPYGMSRGALLAPSGAPCVKPPWGKTVAVDLNSGEVLWETPTLTPKAMAAPTNGELGSISLGGPITTAGGLVFVAADQGEALRALDLETGEELWRVPLPAGGQATPMTYQLGADGKQYVVIAAGGHGGLGTTPGDYVIAFALP